jgi:alpha-beta hydrolase superfamily lysophospholipase
MSRSAGESAASAWPVEYVPTEDGATIAVKRRPQPGGAPVIFIHGLSVNADLWDMPTIQGEGFVYRSLASTLHECGYDIWLMNLRGHGAPLMYSAPAPGQEDWCVDHFILYDLPAVVERVCAQTGERPFVIAASLGAMTLAGYAQGAMLAGGKGCTGGTGLPPDSRHEGLRILADPAEARRRQAALRGCVFVELPAALRWPRSLYDEAGNLRWAALLSDFWRNDGQGNFTFELLSRWGWLETLVQAAGGVPLDWLRADPTQVPLVERLPPALADTVRRAQSSLMQFGLKLIGTFTGHSQHRAEVVIRGRRYIIDHIKAGVLRQLAQCVRDGRFVSALGRPPHVYSDHYHLVELPALVVAGGRDRIANAEVAREAFFEKLAAADRTFVLFEDFGHGEFEAAPAACERVYPVIVRWLEERRGS